MRFRWEDARQIDSYAYQCGWCGREVASERGWEATRLLEGRFLDDVVARVTICHLCTRPTAHVAAAPGAHPKAQEPAPPPGASVDHLPEPVDGIYREARRACGARAWTAAAMALRATISYVAADKGAPEGTFKHYVDWLFEHHFIPPDGKPWVDRIRETGNDAAHELKLRPPAEVLMVLDFTGLLLRFVYEAPHKMAEDLKKLPPNES